MKLKLSSSAMVEQALSRIETLSVDEARSRFQRKGVVLVDLRDIRELKREGRIPGSVHVPRGMLEFWLDPDSPYFKPFFAEGEQFIFYCNKGWRSALATDTAQMMGLAPVSHIEGGFSAWQAAGGDVEAVS